MIINFIEIHKCSGPQAKPFSPNLGTRAMTGWRCCVTRPALDLGLSWFNNVLSLPGKLDPEGLLVGRVYTLRDFFFFFLAVMMMDFCGYTPMLWLPVCLVGSLCKMLIWVKYKIYGPGTKSVTHLWMNRWLWPCSHSMFISPELLSPSIDGMKAKDNLVWAKSCQSRPSTVLSVDICSTFLLFTLYWLVSLFSSSPLLGRSSLFKIT